MEKPAFQKRLFTLLQSCVKLGYHRKIWKKAIIMVIPKRNKPDYTKPRAYRPISLLKVTSKVLEKIVLIRMAALTNNLLPTEQFGGRQVYSATDGVLDIVQRIETTKDTHKETKVKCLVQRNEGYEFDPKTN